ncbi:ATP-binding protein [Massilia sp. YIM B02443]|uniref:PAS domain-containing sensor histidine kinase n=1 Tax=Massilia sp. YIM B02443 TaxID=3050127 RepID=UPI0025B6F93B|nr:ATP-binding protein [Massilia sp. YIM B02443]MDN4036136.1 PAS domain S-box protein [Massilia sp. YIM B02443]
MSLAPAPHEPAVDSATGSNLRFKELFEQSPLSLQLLAPDGRTMRVNTAWEKLWQIHEGSALKQFVLSPDYNVLRDPQLVESGIAALLEQAVRGEPVLIPAVHYDVAALDGRGPARWVTARAHPIKDEAGNVFEVLLMHEDITDKLEAENALRMREERFRSLVMATSQIVWSNTPDGRVDEDSPSWRAFTGQTYEEWREFGWLEAVHPDDRDATRRLWLACVASKSLFETRYRLRRADGAYRWTEVRGVPIVDATGSIREWIGTNTDIHETVMAEAELAQRLEREQRNAALLAKVAHAARKLQTVLWDGDIAEVLVSEVRDILQVHQAVVSITEGANWSQAINAVSLSDKYAPYRAYAESTDGSGIYAEVCRTNQPLRLTQQQLEAHPQWKGFGRHAAAHPPIRGWLAVPLIDRTGKNIGLIQASDKIEGEFSAEDEAILVQLASIAANGFENARLYQSLQEQDRRKDEFLAMLAHELRNPLAPIAAASEMLKLGTASEERIRRSSEVIGRQVRHLTSLIDDLLDVSRVTRGLIELDRALLDPMALVASAVEQSQPLMTARGHSFAIEGDANGARVVGDANRLVQVIANLLNNAAKYTPNGGAIVLTVARDGDVLAISVRDNGTGIDASLLPRIFDLFTQAERTPDRAQGGLGIGLALVKTIVSLHDGQVSAHSGGPGAGSVFTVTLKAA